MTVAVPETPALRHLGRSLAALCWLASATVLGCGPTPAEPERPNVLLVTFDTTRADHLKAYGYEHIETPALSRMARDGIRYARCYSPVPLTLPAHASLMTGLYPFRHGLRDNGIERLDEALPTLPEVLRDHGYTTGAVVGAYVLDSRFGLARGFDHYDDDLAGADVSSRFHFAERPAGAVTDAALAWLDTSDPAPFFLWVHYFDPHMPYKPPDAEGEMAIATPYDLEIAYADRELERLVARVEEIGAAAGRRTLEIFTADHGEALWEHGEPTHGFFVYEEAIHVPLIVRLPSGVGAGTAIETPVSLVDLYPSILAWLGLPPPQQIDGALLPTAQPSAQVNETRALYFESLVPLRYYGWSPLRGVLVGHEKYIEAPTPELYDLRSDPHETRNLVAVAGPRDDELRRRLKELTAADSGFLEPPAASTELEPEAARRLQALGYLATSPAASGNGGSLVDPKNRVELHRGVLNAQTAIDAGEFESALAELAGIVEVDPGNRRSLFLLLDLLKDPALRPKAAELLDRCMAESLPPPFDLLVAQALGNAWSAEQRWGRAERALRVALAIEPENAATNHLLARLLLAQERPLEAALPYAERAHRADAGDPSYAGELAQLLGSLGQRVRALELYEAILEQDPDDPLALNNSAWLYYEAREEIDRALRRSERAVALEPEKPEFRHTYGCLLERAGRREEAERQLRLAPSSLCPR